MLGADLVVSIGRELEARLEAEALIEAAEEVKLAAAMEVAQVLAEAELVEEAAMAEAADVHRCYVKHWMEYAYGRNATQVDTPTYTLLGDASRDGDLAVAAMLTELVASPIFVSRAAEELQ